MSVTERPLIATLRSSTCIFLVRCEVTGKWLSPAYNTFGCNPGKSQDEWRIALKKAEYQFHKVVEENGMLWITPPVGFWLKDGRLVSPECKEGERTEAYYGTKAEIVGRRTLQFIKDDDDGMHFPSLYDFLEYQRGPSSTSLSDRCIIL